uniref:tumor necrosis factor ligand superfamily member 10 isoform X1 n=1 Tax=Podarcis muralis TaxID=64176 RepID=UPI0010A0B145|nr:tumor necrosis factor ligand superfamily member 10 isoform X1 [Podarcis muralis]
MLGAPRAPLCLQRASCWLPAAPAPARPAAWCSSSRCSCSPYAWLLPSFISPTSCNRWWPPNERRNGRWNEERAASRKTSTFFQRWISPPSSSLPKLRDTYSKNGYACLTRENFSLEDLDDSGYSEEGDPCWQVKLQLLRLIKKMIARNQAEVAASSVQGDASTVDSTVSQSVVPRTAAHLTASRIGKSVWATQNSSSRSRFGVKIGTWQTASWPHSFLHNVGLLDGELIILQAGYYYIYSQTYFRFREEEGVERRSDPDSDSVRNPRQMVQYISKRVDTYPDPILLMKSARTSCWAKRAEYGLYSIYQGGVFQLKRNDRIFVSISDMTLVDMDKEASFFGAFLVS